MRKLLKRMKYVTTHTEQVRDVEKGFEGMRGDTVARGQHWQTFSPFASTRNAFSISRQFEERICRNMNLQHNLKFFCTLVRVCLLKQTNSKEYKPKCKAKK